MSKLYRVLSLLLISGLVLSLSFLSTTPTYAQDDGEKDLLETAIDAGNFRVLVALLKAADLDETLQGEGPFTIFAPTDTAFTKIPLPKIRELRNDPDGALTEVLLLHGVSGKLTAVDVVSVINGEADESEIISLSDVPLTFAEDDGVVSVNGAAIVTTDIEASNGVIHVIDTVLLPPSMQDAQASEESDGEDSDSGAMDSEDADDEDVDADSEDSDTEEMDSEDADGEASESEESGAEEMDAEGASREEMDSEEAAAEDAEAESAEAESDEADESGPGNMIDAEEGDDGEADAEDADSEGDQDASDEEADDEEADDEDGTSKEGDESGDETADIEEADAAVPAADLIDTATAAGNFTTLVAAIFTADLVDTLRGDGPFTVFAPSDSVFSALPSGSVQDMLDMPTEELADVLLLHVVPGALLAEELVGLVNTDIETANGKLVPIRANEVGLTIGDAVIVATNIETSNGVIHIIDGVLSGEGLAEASAETTSAPEADTSESAEADAAQPVAAPTPAPAAAPASSTRSADLVDTAIAAGNFNTLVAALTASGLDEVLRTGGSFTIFAPTDEAFAALPEGTVEALLADPTGGLTDLLLYHTVEGLLPADYIVSIDGSSLNTVGGDQLVISVPDDGTVLVNEANVIATDVGATNGLIHVIDRVLLKPAAPSQGTAPSSAPAPVAAPTVPPVVTVPAEIPTVPAEVPTVPPAAATAVPLAAPTVVPTEVASEGEQEFQCLLYYTVDPGNTLSQIAALYGSSVSLLMEANDIEDMDQIYIGQRLCIVR